MEKNFLQQTSISNQSWISSGLDKVLWGSMIVVFPLFFFFFLNSRCNTVYLQRVKITCSCEEKHLGFHFRPGAEDESLQSCTLYTGHTFWELLFHCPCSPGGSEIKQTHRKCLKKPLQTITLLLFWALKIPFSSVCLHFQFCFLYCRSPFQPFELSLGSVVCINTRSIWSTWVVLLAPMELLTCLKLSMVLEDLLNWGFACPPSKLTGQNPWPSASGI